MNKNHRDEGSKKRSGTLIGERKEKVSGYDSPGWAAVDKMLSGDHPTTHMGTIACGGSMGSHNNYKDGGHVMAEQKAMVEGRRNHMRDNMKDFDHAKRGGSIKKHFAAGGVAKVRKDQY